MMREADFKAFLINNNKPQDYIGYCKNIEKAFGGKDMDDIISSYQNISKVRTKLDAAFPNKHSVADYMSGFNCYLEFSVSAASPAVTGSTVSDAPSRYHVARAEGVALTEDVRIVAGILEQEYDHIVQFAKDILIQGDFQCVPVLISDQTPTQDSPDGDGKILGRFFPSEKPYIEIYWRNADPLNAATFRKCLAHEYLHYLHASFAGVEYSAAKKELKEAMADFFSMLYSIHRHGKDDLSVAKACHARWKKNFSTYWPYAKALHFYRVHGEEMDYSSQYNDYVTHGCVGKLVQIFFSSRRPDDAYDALMHS